MKTLLFVLAVFGFGFSNVSRAAIAFQYSCECIDTGLECDGQNYLMLTVDGGRIKGVQLERDRSSMTKPLYATFDSTYKPKKYKDFDRYNVTSVGKKDYPYFLIQKSISEDHGKKGDVKLISKDKNGYGWTWEFECKFNKLVAPLPVKGGASG